MSASMHWSEDLDEALNYWFWLKRYHQIDEEGLIHHLRHVLNQSPIENNRELKEREDWADYLIDWRSWKRDQARKLTVRIDSETLRKHYEAVAAIRERPFAIQWVMARFGERWFLSSTVAALGADGGTAAERRYAVLETARLLPGNSL